jgi:hypothetical protein
MTLALAAALGVPGSAHASSQFFATVEVLWSSGGMRHGGIGLDLSYSYLPVDAPISPDLGGFVQARWMRRGIPAVNLGTRCGLEMPIEDYQGLFWPGLGVDSEIGWAFRPGRENGLHVGGGGSMMLFSVRHSHVPTAERRRRVGPGGELPLPDWSGPSAHDPTLAFGLSTPLISEPFRRGNVVMGRPLRDGSTRLRAPVAAIVHGDPAAATRWIDEGQDEHASIYAFLQLAGELAALGAPKPLVGRVITAAREEAGHAAMCFTLAAEAGGGPVAVGSLSVPQRPLVHRKMALARLALEGLFDGVVGEGEAASRALQEASDARLPRVVAVKERIAHEELGHASLSGDIVSWCCAEGGGAVKRLVQAAEHSLG